MIAPTLHTGRLTLRMPRLEDFQHRAAFYASERSVWEGGPLSRNQAWRLWASEVGQWSLMGYGPFSVEENGDYVGEVGIYHPAQYPEPELGWFVMPEAEGRGIAAEAARAVMAWVRKTFGWDEITNIIAPGNARSIALGLRLGGKIDATRPGIDPGDVVIVHDLTAQGVSPEHRGGMGLTGIPQIETERLILRAPALADWPAYQAVFTSDRAVHIDGPYDEAGAWADFCEGVAGWVLRGAGMWTITAKGDEAALGWLYLWQQKGDPEPEIGWVLTEAAEGKGFAKEAALAVLSLAVARFGKGGFVSYIAAANTPSARLATRLGAARDAAAEAAYGAPDLHIYRHTGVPQ